jgi:hypothetical protein
MTFLLLGGAYAPDLLDRRPAVERDTARVNAAATDLVRLFGLDRRSSNRRLVCCWHRDADGRLAATWEPDILVLPQR